MAFIGIVHLAERLLNQNSAEGQDQQVPQKQIRKASNTRLVEVSEDQFTLSPQNEADPGLFQGTQYTVFSAAADFLMAQSAPPSTEQTVPLPTATVLSETSSQQSLQTTAPATPQAKAASA